MQVDFDVLVEVDERLVAGLGSIGGSNVALVEVEVGSQVRELGHLVVEDGDAGGSCQDDVLGSLDSDLESTLAYSLQSLNEDLHLDQFSHGLVSEDTDLS